jgi:O-antigen ligase
VHPASLTRQGIANLALPENGIDRNNVISAFLMGALPALAGSAISFMLYTFFVWGIISLALKRFPFRMTRSDRVLAWTFTAFAASIVLTALLGDNWPEIPHSIIWLLAFLSPWIVIPRLRASEGTDLLTPFIVGAAVGAAGAALLAAIQMIWFNAIRAEGGGGNAAVFATMTLCLMGTGALNIASPSRLRRALAILAVIGGAVALAMSLTRGVGLAMFPILILLAIYAPARWRAIVMRPISLLPLAIAAISLYAVQRSLDVRWEQTTSELYRLLAGHQTTKGIGSRLQLWQAGWEAFTNSPLLGYGIQNRMASLEPELTRNGVQIFGYSHAHNGFLSFALDGGILTLATLVMVLCVPTFIAWHAPRDSSYRIRLFLALVIGAAYVCSGTTQIMFKHDIMDAFFVFSAMLVAASIPAEPRTAPATATP